MEKSVAASLSKFLQTKPDVFANPFTDTLPEEEDRMEAILREEDSHPKEKRSRKKKEDKLDRFLNETDAYFSTMNEENDIADDFDGYLESYLMDDDDEEFRRDLVRYGRKYARDTKQSRESSEIEKAYATQESELIDLIADIEKDKQALDADIQKIRTYRSVNYKTFAELIDARTSLHTTHLNAIKEKNAIAKSKIELQMKADKASQEDTGDASIANRMVQNLFSMGRGALIGESYADISGASEAGNVKSPSSFDVDQMIDDHYYLSDTEETDGDKFIKYEGIFDKYILEYNDKGPTRIYAADHDGNEIPDYPVNPNINDLDLQISESTNTATDKYANQYELRKASE